MNRVEKDYAIMADKQAHPVTGGDTAAASLALARRHVGRGDGRRLCLFLREGSPRLALVPGSFQDHRQWLEVASRLDRRLGLAIVELPGHGESDKWRGEPSIGQFAHDAWGVLDACGFGQAVYLCGHSIGGMIVQEMGRLRPRMVEGVIPVEGWTNRQAAVDTGFGDLMYNTLTPELQDRQNALRALAAVRLSDDDRRAFATAWTRWDGTAFLQSTEIPVLSLWGDRGRPRPTRAQLHVPERPNISVAWIADASHNLPLERPGEVAEALTRFIRESECRGTAVRVQLPGRHRRTARP